MNDSGPGSTTDLEQIEWLLSHLASESPGVTGAVTIASDGRLLTASEGLTTTAARRLAAVTTAFTSLARGVGTGFELGEPTKLVVDLDRGCFVIKPINVNCVLGVVASGAANLDELADDLTTLADHVGGAITADVVGALAAAIPDDNDEP